MCQDQACRALSRTLNRRCVILENRSGCVVHVLIWVSEKCAALKKMKVVENKIWDWDEFNLIIEERTILNKLFPALHFFFKIEH